MTVSPGSPDAIVSPDAAGLAAAAAQAIISAAHAAIAARGRFTLVLSGGSTPERTYLLLAQPQQQTQIDWRRTWLFFGDERFVPHDDPRSNYYMAVQTLIRPAHINPEHVLAVPTDAGSPAKCAAAYESTLRNFFAVESGQLTKGFPQFDLILLGLGDDGHTASLFPGKPTLDEKVAWVTWSPPGVLPPPVDRVTFTYPLLNAARQVMFLVSGAKKATIVRAVLAGSAVPNQYPAAGLRPTNGKLTWLLDASAAELIGASNS